MTLASVESHIADCDRCRSLVLAIAESQPGGDPASATASAALEVVDDSPLAAGTRVGRYVIESIVGAGAMGVVYAARDPALDRRVALKLLRRQAGDKDGRSAQRLVREGQAMARLSHRNVVTVHDVGEALGRVFVAMELIEGRALREWLRERPRSISDILAVFVAAGHGLSAAHAARLVHRDFKPDNVLVHDDGRVCVSDFGLARLPERDGARGDDTPDDAEATNPLVTRSGVLVGTPAYMAPEQLARRVADERSDVFAFSVALHEALYSARPFEGATLGALRANVRAGARAPIPRGARVPARLQAILSRGLAAEPSSRYPSMTSLLAELEAFGKPSSAFAASIVALARPSPKLLVAVAGLPAVAAPTLSAAVPAPTRDGAHVDPLDDASRVAWRRDRGDHAVAVVERGGALCATSAGDGSDLRVEIGPVAAISHDAAFVVEREADGRVRVAVERGRVHVLWALGAADLEGGESDTFPRETIPASPVVKPIAAASTAAPAAPPNADDWRDLARHGAYDDAFAQLRREGGPLDAVNDLLLAADVARLGHHPADAVAPLRQVLRAHSGDPRASLAAFTLGRVLLMQLGDPAGAADAFATARALSPSGALAEDALAREVEARARAGQSDVARRLASEYGDRYPTGARRASVRRLGGLE